MVIIHQGGLLLTCKTSSKLVKSISGVQGPVPGPALEPLGSDYGDSEISALRDLEGYRRILERIHRYSPHVVGRHSQYSFAMLNP